MNHTKNGPKKDQISGTLARGLRLMAVLASAERAVGLSELTALTGFSKPTAHRLARALVDLGYLEQSNPPSALYSLKPRILELGYTYLAGLQIRELARPAMRTLADQFGENVTLSVLDGTDVVYVERHEARPTGLVFKTSVGSRMPVYCSSMGKAIIAWLPDAQRIAIIQSCGFESFTEFTITDGLQLEVELKKVRANGFAINDQTGYWTALAYFGCFLTVFNLIPISPLDGGRVAKAVSVWTNVAGLIILLAFIAGEFLLTGVISPVALIVMIFGAIGVFSRFKHPDGLKELSIWGRVGVAAAYMAILLLALGGTAFTSMLLTSAGVSVGF